MDSFLLSTVDQVTSAASSAHNAVASRVQGITLAAKHGASSAGTILSSQAKDMANKVSLNFPNLDGTNWNGTNIIEKGRRLVKDYLPSGGNTTAQLPAVLYKQAAGLAEQAVAVAVEACTNVLAHATSEQLIGAGLGGLTVVGLVVAYRKRPRPQQAAGLIPASDTLGNLMTGPAGSPVVDTDETGGEVKRRRMVQTEMEEEEAEVDDTDMIKDIEMQPTQVEVSEEEEEESEEEEEEDEDDYQSLNDEEEEDQISDQETSIQIPQAHPQSISTPQAKIVAFRSQPTSSQTTTFSREEVANVMVTMGKEKEEIPTTMKVTALEPKADQSARSSILASIKSNSKRLQPEQDESESEEEKDMEGDEFSELRLPVKNAKQKLNPRRESAGPAYHSNQSPSRGKTSSDKVHQGQENKDINETIDLTGE